MSAELPVVFLAFANASIDHLGLLKAESRDVFGTLEPLQQRDLVAIRREESCEFDELYDGLVKDRDRVVVFHYAGHANGETLNFEGGGGGREGLARMLGQQSSLKLVFLNGCASQGHAPLLLDAGVPAVIATSVEVGDQKAQEFSTAFYKALAEGQSIPGAFESSRGFIEGKYRVAGSRPAFTRGTRHIGTIASPSAATPVLEWGLFIRDDCAADLEQWRLPDAKAQWRVQLADAHGPVRGLDGALLPVEHLLPMRTLPAVVCEACGTTSTARSTAPTDSIERCPLCGSDKITHATVSSGVPDQMLPFTVTGEHARELVLKHPHSLTTITSALPLDVRMTPLFVPYWVFDVATRTGIEAERRLLSPGGGPAPVSQWEPVKDSIDLGRLSYLAKATTVPIDFETRAAGADPGWFWTLDQAVALKGLDRTDVFLPMDRHMQAAFDEVAASLANELAIEVVDRIGGIEQRNVTTDTRYRRLSARTVLLPHWSVIVEQAGQRTNFLVNGLTGAARLLHLPVRESPGKGTPAVTKRTYEPTTLVRGPSLGVSVFAGVGIGLMVGSLLGLAVPPGNGTSIVSYFIAAAGAALAALLGLNDSHFSTAKGLRIGAFGLAVLLAAPTGVFVREHRWLEPSLESQRERLRGFVSPGQLDDAVSEIAERPAAGLVAGNRRVSRCEDFGVKGDVSQTLDAYTLQGWSEMATAIGKIAGEQNQLAALNAARLAICHVEAEMQPREGAK